MTAWGRKTLVKMAELAQIDLSEEELAEFAPQFDELATYLATINELDTKFEALEQAGANPPPPAAERPDEVREGKGPGPYLAAAPAHQGFSFQVPRIID